MTQQRANPRAPEWSPGVPVTGDNLEPVFLAALGAGDVEGVEHCIRLAVAVDPARAVRWWDDLQFALRVRSDILRTREDDR